MENKSALSILRINHRLRVSEVYTSESEKETSPEKPKMSEHVMSKSETGTSPVLLKIPEIKANFTLESEKKYNPEKPKIPEVNDYVVVRLLTQKSAVHYVAIIISKAEDEVKVKFLRKTLGNKFSFPSTDDISVIDLDEVVEILSQPTINNRHQYTFNLDFTKYKNMH